MCLNPQAKSLLRLLALLAILGWTRLAGAYNSFSEAYAAMGFDPFAPGNLLVVHFSDPHFHTDPNDTPPYAIITNLDFRLVNLINQMNPPPAKILISGDLSSSYSTVPGLYSNAWSAYLATNELRNWYPELRRLTNVALTNILWVPGNHDQTIEETHADLFCALLGCSPHQTVDIGGIRFFLLNGGNAGVPSDSERQWFLQQVGATSPTQTVAVMLHQPPFEIAAERGNGLLLRQALGNWPTRWYVLHGHAHYQSIIPVKYGNSLAGVYGVGTANTNVFNGLDFSAGFRVFCLSNGIVGSVYYHFDDLHVSNADFQVEPLPDWGHPIPFVPAFEGIDGLLWRRLKKPVPAPEVIYADTHGSAYWYAYTQELQWSLPLINHSNQATHFLILAGDLRGTVSFSADRTNWIDAPLSQFTNQVYSVPIPPQIASGAVGYARFVASCCDNFIGGWGLSTTNPGPRITFPQLLPMADQTTDPCVTVKARAGVIDPYAPPDVLSFRLLSAPSGASLDAGGTFSWTPQAADAMQSFLVAIQAYDDGIPEFSATAQFRIYVSGTNLPALIPGAWHNGAYEFCVPAQTGLLYTIEYSSNLSDWRVLLSTNPSVSPFRVTDPDAAAPFRFYRSRVLR